LALYTVFSAWVMMLRLAALPTSTSLGPRKHTTEAWVRSPHSLGITVGLPSITSATALYEVPRSMPIASSAMCRSLHCAQELDTLQADAAPQFLEGSRGQSFSHLGHVSGLPGGRKEDALIDPDGVAVGHPRQKVDHRPLQPLLRAPRSPEPPQRLAPV